MLNLNKPSVKASRAAKCGAAGGDSVVLLQRSNDRDAVIEVERVDPVNQYACQVTAFCNSVAAGKLVPPAENGLANMRVLESALEQAKVNR